MMPLTGQLGGMCGIDRSTPIGITVFVDDGAQIVGDFPGVAHVGHRVQNDLDFAGHEVLLSWEFQSEQLLDGSDNEISLPCIFQSKNLGNAYSVIFHVKLHS
jgi:hypothetical protein